MHAIIKTINKEDSKYLVISISPFTFFACIVLKIFKKNPIVYLRSDGYSEYKAILGFAGPYIYHIMYSIISKISLLISCRDYILRGKKGEIVSPSQISKVWMENLKEQSINEIKLLYVGRIRVEKGIFSLLKILKQSNQFTLSIVGAEKTLDHKIIQNNINVYEIENNERKLIQFYDDHNIFVLPSFTEGHPMVLLEALSRLRPVIIFEEIKHIIGDKRGIFVAKRNTKSFCETIEHIKINYAKIQKDMKKNQLPTKEIFLKKFSAIISNLD